MKPAKYLFVITLLLSWSAVTHSQILKRIIDKSINKAEQRLEDKAAELLAEMLVRQLEKQVDKYFEDLAREQARQDSIERTKGGEEIDSEEMNRMMRAIMDGMGDASKLAESYVFTLILDTEIGTGKETDQARFFYHQDHAYFGVEQIQQADTHFMLFDFENDVIALLKTDKKGNKTGQVLPNVMGLAAGMVPSDQEAQSAFSIKKGSKKKKIAGYTSLQYLGEDDDSNYEFFLTEDLPSLWSQQSAKTMERFAAFQYSGQFESLKGMLMESKVTNKTKPKDVDHFLVTKVTKSEYKVRKEEYQFGE